MRRLDLLLAALASAAILSPHAAAASQIPAPVLVSLQPATFEYRVSGEFLAAGTPVDAPKIVIEMPRVTAIMAYQVSVGEYDACVADKACEPADTGRFADPALPVTGVSYSDAEAYAKWLSARTGQTFRLPTDEEWAFAAGSRFVDDALGATADAANPAARWLKRYDKYAARGDDGVKGVQPRGYFGANENGLYDLSGTVWEWTSSCYRRNRRDAAGESVVSSTENCGVRIVEGRHRAYVSFFLRDAKGGGCTVGSPPDFLGFRLVRDDAPPMSLRGIKTWFRGFLGS